MTTALYAIDKPAGITSQGVVAQLRRSLRQRRIGHAGTLDPFATGVLIVLTGVWTKLMPYLSHERKTYRARLQLGVATSTGDPEGEPTERAPVPSPNSAQLAAVASALTGQVQLQLPAYSAVHIDGERAYKRARRGESLDMPERSAQIHQLQIQATPEPAQLIFEAEVSGGTYIRALGERIARELGTCGHLTELRRTRCCDIDIADAQPADTAAEHLRSLDPQNVCREHHYYRIGAASAAWLRQGRPPDQLALECFHQGLNPQSTCGILFDEQGAPCSIIDHHQMKILRNI